MSGLERLMRGDIMDSGEKDKIMSATLHEIVQKLNKMDDIDNGVKNLSQSIDIMDNIMDSIKITYEDVKDIPLKLAELERNTN